MSDIPNPREELERKTVEALDGLAHKLSQRRITTAEFGAAGKLLWQVTAGLVDGSISDLCSAVAEQAKQTRMRQVFAGADNVLVFSWYPEEDDYQLEMYRYGMPRPCSTRTVKCAFDERAAKFDKFFATLESQGYFKA
jgi:hypothetical protein